MSPAEGAVQAANQPAEGAVQAVNQPAGLHRIPSEPKAVRHSYHSVLLLSLHCIQETRE
jgi:hypothetical protein